MFMMRYSLHELLAHQKTDRILQRERNDGAEEDEQYDQQNL